MKDYIVIDIETTGLHPDYARIIEIGAAKVIDDQTVAVFNMLVNPEVAIPENIINLTGITNEMVVDAPIISQVMPMFLLFCEDLPILGHNIPFDFSFLKTNAMRLNLHFEKNALDTLLLSRQYMDYQNSYSLSHLLKFCSINRENAHRALDDALATHELFQIIKHKYMDTHKVIELRPSPLMWKPKKQSPMTDKQRKFLLSLMNKHKVALDFDLDALTKSEASQRIDGLIGQYGKGY
ncbi:DNA polymerase III subunit epsilon [Petrocella atlantisensis]|jgi:DNA polymerase-3 subunit alpha (Gram-positive type)|uniref:DNA polymerase III subunit epsilon n=1 Tax=Petrocella atlantisensis TaxID=2173034 RepID=A0A3P7S7J3_9FIRM|nr:3'-5' exonuclease [Petrocella atlantisensis]MCF8018570.1 3'-5' exoribonuclease [Vallitaleaceae bacterium]VDN48109.1 DNA polymerase III subunit epsilon [Petrocella atlantisensis]